MLGDTLLQHRAGFGRQWSAPQPPADAAEYVIARAHNLSSPGLVAALPFGPQALEAAPFRRRQVAHRGPAMGERQMAKAPAPVAHRPEHAVPRCLVIA